MQTISNSWEGSGIKMSSWWMLRYQKDVSKATVTCYYHQEHCHGDISIGILLLLEHVNYVISKIVGLKMWIVLDGAGDFAQWGWFVLTGRLCFMIVAFYLAVITCSLWGWQYEEWRADWKCSQGLYLKCLATLWAPLQKRTCWFPASVARL